MAMVCESHTEEKSAFAPYEIQFSYLDGDEAICKVVGQPYSTAADVFRGLEQSARTSHCGSQPMS